MTSVLVVRLDSDGDVLLSGPAVRAVAAGADRVVMLAGPRGAAAAQLLPGLDEVLVWRCPWVDGDPAPVDRADIAGIAARLAGHCFDQALVFTSFHQSPLPTALLLRMAGVGWIGAVSEDYPGSLLDLRHRLPETGLHEVERMCSLAAAAGFPAVDGNRLRLRGPLPDVSALTGSGPYVVLHPGASVPARAPQPDWSARTVAALARAGHRVLVTGGPGETALTAQVASHGGVDLGGRTDLAGLAAVLAGAGTVVVGNTGPAHLAAAVGTPVVSLFAPVVPAERWRPWGVPTRVLGDQTAPCRLTRARHCPVPGHPCLQGVAVADVVSAVDELGRTGVRDLRHESSHQEVYA